MHPNPVHLPPYPMPSVISPMAPLLGLLVLFLLISARYGAGLNLWGDQAYSLNVAAKSVGEILAADPFHLPTYYLLLHPLVGFFPAGNELPLRLIHALIFSIGLGFCWRIARSLLGRGWALWGVMILTILLPNYIVYATNIRMFALLFAASLALLWTAHCLLTPGVNKRRAMAWHLLAALLCALVDWPACCWWVSPGWRCYFCGAVGCWLGAGGQGGGRAGRPGCPPM